MLLSSYWPGPFSGRNELGKGKAFTQVLCWGSPGDSFLGPFFVKFRTWNISSIGSCNAWLSFWHLKTTYINISKQPETLPLQRSKTIFCQKDHLRAHSFCRYYMFPNIPNRYYPKGPTEVPPQKTYSWSPKKPSLPKKPSFRRSAKPSYLASFRFVFFFKPLFHRNPMAPTVNSPSPRSSPGEVETFEGFNRLSLVKAHLNGRQRRAKGFALLGGKCDVFFCSKGALVSCCKTQS